MDWLSLVALITLQITGAELEVELSRQCFKLKISFRRKPKA